MDDFSAGCHIIPLVNNPRMGGKNSFQVFIPKSDGDSLLRER